MDIKFIMLIHEYIVIKIFKMLKKNYFEAEIIYPAKLSLKCHDEVKIYKVTKIHQRL